MKEFIKLPVLFLPNIDEETYKFNELIGKNTSDDSVEEGFIFVSVDDIIMYNEDDDGLTAIGTACGEIRINMMFSEFFSKINKFVNIIDF